MKTPEVVTKEKKKREKPLWYRQTIRRFTTYSQDKLRLQILIAQLGTEFPSNTAQIALSPGRSIGSTSDQTGGYASKRWDIENEIRQLELRIYETDIILNSLGPNQKKLIELKYIQRFNKDFWIARQVGLAERTYYRMLDELVLLAAELFGYVKRDQISFKELGWRE